MHGWNTQSIGQSCNSVTFRVEGRIGQKDKGVRALLSQVGKDCLQVGDAISEDRSQLQSQRSCGGFGVFPLQAVIKVVRVAEDTDSFDRWDRLPENFESLFAQLDRVERHACHVAAR